MTSPHLFQNPIQPLSERHDRASFVCGVEALDRYFQRQASQDMKRKIAITYVQPEDDGASIAGYYALASTSVEGGDLPEEISHKLPKYPRIPATLLGRLAVGSKWRGRGLGKRLLMDALERSYEQSHRIASTAVVVDAKSDDATAFYAQYGFQVFPQNSRRLLIPMTTIEELYR